MKMSGLYDEAVDAGLDRKEASYIAAAQELGTLAREIKDEQAKFLRELGMSMEDARALDDAGRAVLNEKWLAYKKRQ